jgi:hypothetical protein
MTAPEIVDVLLMTSTDGFSEPEVPLETEQKYSTFT